MTDYERGRAAGLAEAVKLIEGYREAVKHHGAVPINPYEAMETASNEIIGALRALSTSPGEHVLVPAPRPIAELPSHGWFLGWFIGNNAPEAAQMYRPISQSLEGDDLIWDGGDHRPKAWFSHFIPSMPPPRAMLSAKE